MATDEKIIDKIHKLLALATSDNVNEAEIAAAKAQQMLLEYNVSEEELNSFSDKKNERVIEVVTNQKNNYNRSRWHENLANTVAKANLCKLIISGRGLVWIGKPANIEVAQYIFENLVRDLTRICESTWNTFNEVQKVTRPSYARIHGKTWKNNFYHGANQSIRERLNANLRQLKETQPAINALVVNNDVEINEYVELKWPRLRYSGSTFTRNSSGFEAGKAAGRVVSFTSGVGAGGSSGPKLLKGG